MQGRQIVKWCALAALLIAAPALAQKMPDIGFESVGRGRPLAASVTRLRKRSGRTGSARPRQPRTGRRRSRSPQRLPPGRRRRRTTSRCRATSSRATDFYARQGALERPALFPLQQPAWRTEYQRGILQPSRREHVGQQDRAGPWGHCDIGVPREAIVSPYGFKTAQEHYEALNAETTKRGGPTSTPTKDFPDAEWNGVYERPSGRAARNQSNWYWGRHSQIPTVLSVLTPKYQEWMVQEAYHQVRGNAIWPSTFCWPEGFMRRWYPAAVWEHYVIATPDLVHVRAGVARNFIQDIYVGRDFNMEDVANGGVPRLGAAVPRWYGETIGFWDKDVLITWTSNIQGWKSHSQFEFSSKMQSIEIYTPIREDGKFIGLNHETILYDEEALAEPVRIVRNLHKINEFTDADAGAVPLHRVRADDLLGQRRQHAADAGQRRSSTRCPTCTAARGPRSGSSYFEQGMSKPEEDGDLFNFD